jgi:NAD(P)H-nitrite reductase large subunit
LGTSSSDDYEHGLEAYHELLQRNSSSEQDLLLCECFCKTTKDIVESLSLRESESSTPEEILSSLKIGTGCGSCKEGMLNWLKNYLEER